MDGEIVINIRQEKVRKRLFGLKKEIIVTYRPQGFLFGMSVWIRLWEIQEKKELDPKETTILLYYLAADNYQKEQRQKTDFTIDDVERWIKEMPQSDANAIAQCLVDSKVLSQKVSDFFEKSINNEEKKK